MYIHANGVIFFRNFQRLRCRFICTRKLRESPPPHRGRGFLSFLSVFSPFFLSSLCPLSFVCGLFFLSFLLKNRRAVFVTCVTLARRGNPITEGFCAPRIPHPGQNHAAKVRDRIDPRGGSRLGPAFSTIACNTTMDRKPSPNPRGPRDMRCSAHPPPSLVLQHH